MTASFDEIQARADEGDVSALFQLGELYHRGTLVELSLVRALEFYGKAAEAGHPEAQNSLGTMYLVAEGVDQNYSKALELFKKSADNGNPLALHNIALMTEEGQGCSQDSAKAYKLFLHAAESGVHESQYRCSVFSLLGFEAPIDFDRALYWMQKAAVSGNPKAGKCIEAIDKIVISPGIGPRELRILKTLLMYPRYDEGKTEWPGIRKPWLQRGETPSIRQANKFFLAASISFQFKDETAWENTRRYAEKVVGDPPNLWQFICCQSEKEWKKLTDILKLHRLKMAHGRIWRIANIINKDYQGDARLIWANQTPSEVFSRLQKLVKHGLSENILNMIVGVLLDTGQIKGDGDIHADTHVCRTLGRSINGKEFSLNEAENAIVLARTLYPANPWALDRPLYFLGQSNCYKKAPNCRQCCLSSDCNWKNAKKP